MTQISANEILIFGGNYTYGGYYGDGYIFNTEDRSIVKCFDTPFKFFSANNQCVMARPGEVAAIVTEANNQSF